MFDLLRKRLVQEVPEELSVCEFECAVTTCTTSDWRACKLRSDPGLNSSKRATSASTRNRQREVPVATPALR